MSRLQRLRGSPAPFIAVNGMILATFYFGLVQPIASALSEGEAGLADRRATLARFRAVTTQAHDVANYAKRVEDDNARGELLAGDSDGLVAANLQAKLKAAAAAANITVRSLQMLPSKTLEGSTLTGARIEVNGSLPAINALVRALETAIPLLLITDADLRRETLVWGAPDNENASLSAQFDVFGAAKPRARR